MPDGKKINKRQNQYKKFSSVYHKYVSGDKLSKYKTALYAAFKNISDMIEAYNSYDKDEFPEGDKNITISTIEMNKIINLYQLALKNLEELSAEINKRIIKIEKSSEVEKTRQKEKLKLLKSNSNLFNKQIKVVSKDLMAFKNALKNTLATRVDAKISDIFESSRMDSSYTAQIPENNAPLSGALNERLPITISKNDISTYGYFTPDVRPTVEGDVRKAFDNAIKKYGKDADFIKYDMIYEIMINMRKRNNNAYKLLLNLKHLVMMSTHAYIIGLITTNMTQYHLDTLLSERKDLNIFVDVLSDMIQAEHKFSVTKLTKINTMSFHNRRNEAMSKMAEILECTDIIAESKCVKLNINDKPVKGSFMKHVDGVDIQRSSLDSNYYKANHESVENLGLKKNIADLQILDFICGNPDRHILNLIYDFDTDENGNVILKGVKGIDNDTSFIGALYSSFNMSQVNIADMKVITKKMADVVLNLDINSLKCMLYTYGISIGEMDAMGKRLKELQDKIKKDQKEYDKGYEKGYLLEGRIKIVEDDELEMLSFKYDLKNQKFDKDTFDKTAMDLKIGKLKKPVENKKMNLFDRVFCVCRTPINLESYRNDEIIACKKSVMEMTVGSAGLLKGITDLMARDKHNSFFVGSSTGYNRMYDALVEIKNDFIEWDDGVPSAGSLQNNQVQDSIVNAKRQLQRALELVNTYIEYKDNKPLNKESWRNLQGIPHVADRTERRYKHAKAAYTLLQNQLKKYEDYVDHFNKICNYDSKEISLKRAYRVKKEKLLNKNSFEQQEERIIERNKKNHLSRIEYIINQDYINITEADKGKGKIKPEGAQLVFDMDLGFALNGLEDEERAAFKSKVEKLTGKKLPDDETIMKRSLASYLIALKNQTPPDFVTADDATFRIGANLESLPNKGVNSEYPVDEIIQSKEFDAFYQNAVKHVQDIGNDEYPGIVYPNRNMNVLITDEYYKAKAAVDPTVKDKMSENEVDREEHFQNLENANNNNIRRNNSFDSLIK